MATTEHFRNGGGTTLPFTFPILANSDLKVEIYNATTGVWDLKTENTIGQTDNDYTISNTNVVFNSATPSGTGNVHIYRNTNVDNPQAVFAAGSSIRAVDLNNNQTQVLYSTQEAVGQLVRETDLKDSIVTSAKIANGTIVDGDINASANINGSKLLNDSVALTKLGSGALPTDITVASANIVNGTIVDADIATGTLDNRYYTETELDAGQLDNRYYRINQVDAGQLDNRYYTETELNAGQLDNRYYTETELNAGQLDNRYYTETELLNGALDGRYFTETEADARYYNLASAEEIQSGETWTAADNKVATTAAIDARIIDLVDDVGGFVPIANETSFPNANPDVNNGAGTLVSVPLANNLTSNGSGVITISNGTVGNSTVTITGATASSTFAQGFGIIVETTSTLNTYTFHRYVPKATEVTTVAGNTSNINTVAGIDGNITTVAGISGNVTTVAGISGNVTTVANNDTNVSNVANAITNVNNVGNSISQVNTVATSIANVNSVAADATDIGAVAGKATEIGRLGTADAVADLAILGTTDVVADMNTLGTSSNVTNMNTLAGISGNVTTVAGISSDVTTVANDGTDIGTVAGISGNVTTVAGISGNVTTVANDQTDIGLVAGSIGNVNTTASDIANVNTVAGSIDNVNTVGTNITNVNNASTYLNNFLALYLGEAASAPSVDTFGNPVTEGDFYFNTVNKQLQVFNGSVFTSIFAFAFEIEKAATAAFNALYTAAVGQNSINLGGLAITGAVFGDEKITTNRISLTKGSATYNLGGI